jgi:hypothetical protein
MMTKRGAQEACHDRRSRPFWRVSNWCITAIHHC